MIALFRLIRLPNLLIVAITQYLLFYRIVLPPLYHADLRPGLDNLHFLLLMISTLCIAAAGYIINDIYDYEIDKINKPKSLIVTRLIPASSAQFLYIILTAIGPLLGAYIAWRLDNWYFFLIYPLTILLLWWYSYQLKKTAFWGNLTVAICCTLVVLMIPSAEIKNLQLIDNQSIEGDLNYRFWIAAAYAIFAFLSTLFREIVKDLEDMKGDKRGGANTLPLRLGVAASKKIAFAIAALLLASVVYAAVFVEAFSALWSHIYLGLFIIIPAFYALFELNRATDKEQYNCVSKVTKLIMLTGLLYLFIV